MRILSRDPSDVRIRMSFKKNNRKKKKERDLKIYVHDVCMIVKVTPHPFFRLFIGEAL